MSQIFRELPMNSIKEVLSELQTHRLNLQGTSLVF